ncbi:hypothetical protein [Pedobacter africanus]|uniref:Uncharacterized protein n=1 Tax=Pedobacter africanus TaxID=151894 RepID=A0A1W2DFT4_9SPHI|nr:hypothetical protein [Pedobacter africanus]SMC96305.1 hypothetical protein SAMN04488524_3756 [Pedobacter africanus]
MIKQARNYVISGLPEPKHTIKTIVRFAAPATLAVANIAPWKYNKKNTMAFEWDDASIGALTGLNILNAAFYTDGCGNNINYSATLAINGANETTGIPYTYDGTDGRVSAAQMISMINAGWEISDHGYYHDQVGFGATVNPLQSTILMQSFIKNLLNYWTRSKVVPNADAGHAQAAHDIGYLYSTSQGTFDTFTPVWMFVPPGNYNDVPPLFGALRRYFTDQLAVELNDIKAIIDTLLSGNNTFFRLASHTIDQTAFQNLVDYIETNAEDELWVASHREVLEYREMKALPTYQEFNGDTLTIVTDITSLTNKNRYKDLSFNIASDQPILSVTTDGDNATFNATTGLVNIFKQKKQWLDTDVDLSLYFDHIYDSSKARNGNSLQVADGDIVASIPDLGKTGGKDMYYTGPVNPVLTQAPPRYRSQVGGYIQFHNQFGTAYVSEQYAVNKPFPRELFFVANQAKFNTYEALWNSFNSHYVGDFGDNAIRLRGATDESPVGFPNTIPIGFPIRQNYLFHIKYILDVLGIRCEVRINKSLVTGDPAYTYSDGRLNKPSFAWGADTNSGNFGACFQAWSFTELTADQRTIIENELYARYNIGVRLALPMAEGLAGIKNGTQYTASYNYVNPLGYAEDTTARSVKWVIYNAGIQSGTYFTAVDGLLTWNSNTYPLPSGYEVGSVEVICVDVIGNRFHVPEKVFTVGS